MKVVIDTNCLIVSIPKRNVEYWLYEAFSNRMFDWLISNEIMAENADFLVTHDKHFSVLKNIPFPTVAVVKLPEFRKILFRE